MSSYKYSVYNSAKRGGSRNNNRSGGNKRRGEYINPARFIAIAKTSQPEDYAPKQVFKDFALDPIIHRNLAAKGFITPSPIQDQTIPIALEGRDVIGIANTGTGKTAAFAVPVVQALITNHDAK